MKTKHAYILTVNSNFQVLNTCLRLLDYESNDFYFVFDKKSFPSVEMAKTKIDVPRFATIKYLNVIEINWGGYSQVAAVLSLIQAVLDSGTDYSFIHFLQNSDLPIKSNVEILRYFEKHSGKEFVNVERKSMQWAERSCQYRYFFSHNRFYRKSKMLKIVNIALARTQQLFGIKCNKGITFYYGSALFSITLPFAKYVFSKRREIKKIFRWSLAPDEKFLQTILMSSPFATNIAFSDSESTFNAMLIDWHRSRQKNSPHVWTIDELDYLLSMPAGFCFARKFIESEDLEIVRALESKLNNEGDLL